jgi:CheY-like chemotaxis protein
MRQIRALPVAAHLPAIALTAYARDEDRQEAIAAGFQQHVAKPVEPSNLISAIVQLAEKVE